MVVVIIEGPRGVRPGRVERRVPRRRCSTNSAFIPACHGHSHKGRAALADPGVRNGNGHRRDPGLIARAARVDPKQRTGNSHVTSHVRT